MAYIIYVYGKDIGTILLQVDLIFFPLVFLLSLFQYSLSAWRWCYIASKTQSSITYYDAFRYYYIAGFLNNILPTGIAGDIYRTINIKVNNKKTNNFIKSLQSVILERLSGQIALIATFILSLQIFFLSNQKYLASIYVLFSIIFLIGLIKLLFFYKKKINTLLTSSISLVVNDFSNIY